MRTTSILLSALACLSVASCTVAAEPTPTGLGRLQFGLSVGELHPDITYAEVKIVAADATCDAAAVLNAEGKPAILKAVRESETLPLTEGAGIFSAHPFFDALFVLDPAKYHICATPMTAKGASEVCPTAEGNATVAPEATTEVLLVSQCKGDPSGGLDVIVALNDPPYIEGLTVDPSKFVCVGAKVTATVKAIDPNGDFLKYFWTYDGEKLLPYPDGPKMVLPTKKYGNHTVKVTVVDTYGATAALSFPLHVDCLSWPCDGE